MGKFKKGESGNPGGRPKGAKNKSSEELREIVGQILTKHFTPYQLAKDLKQLEPNQRIGFMLKLLEFSVPRLKQTEMNIEFEKLPESQLDMIIQELINNSNHAKD